MRPTIALLAALASLAIALPARPASAWCQMTTSRTRPPGGGCVTEGEPLAWRRPCTAVVLSNTAPFGSLSDAQVRDVLRRSFATWTSVTCEGALTGLEVTVTDDLCDCSEAVHNASGHNVHAITYVPEGWADERGHDPRAYAVTFVWHDPATGEILDVDMEINGERGPYVECPAEGCPAGSSDLANVITHEIGHYFGIAHTPDDPLATMWSMAETGELLKRDLRDDDVEAVCTIYGGEQLDQVCDATPRGGWPDRTNGVYSSGPGGCGCAVPGTGGGGSGTSLALLGLGLAIAMRRRRGR